MKNLLFVLMLAMIFASCRSNHHRNNEGQEMVSNDSTQVENIDSVAVTPPAEVAEPTLEEKFYSEIFNKRNLEIEEWKDSTLERCVGEGTETFMLPVKIQHGDTQGFLFKFITSYEYYEESGVENKPFVILFKPRGEAIEGKTLAEDKQNREFYEWKTLYPPLSDSLKMLCPTIVYPKKFIHKNKEE